MAVRSHAPLLTVEDYKKLPEAGPRYQLVEGELYMTPAPNRFHHDISRNIQRALDRYLDENPIGILYNAPFDVYLTRTDVFQPDLIVVLEASRSILTDAGAEGPPEFVIEILSPSNRELDLVKKKGIYARLGVKEMWIIDPEPGSIEIYRFEQNSADPIATLYASDTLTTPLLTGFSMSVSAVFRRP
ncbi:MAG: Uma2 family endonuclease [Verrucomicrobia bacterium]|nr:Uma2 family endonuclease [Verrucomicrobiota bacterium]